MKNWFSVITAIIGLIIYIAVIGFILYGFFIMFNRIID